MSRFICFDLEGPLSPHDNAYDLMKLIPGGDRVFETISRYDDLLALQEREGYEPGDTLALIVPFLLYHGISERHIESLAERAMLVEGAGDLIADLLREWKVFCISTSYQQYALTVTRRLSIAAEHVACTLFPLDRFAGIVTRDDLAMVERVEEALLSSHSIDEERTNRLLDRFFWHEMSSTALGGIVEQVKPVGGRRKVEALTRFAREYRESLGGFVAVGDSITDCRMLQSVNQAGGLAIAFNANEYALPHANVAMASTHLSDLLPLLEAWAAGGMGGVKEMVKAKERNGGHGDRDHFHWVQGLDDLAPVLETHRRIRRLVRDEAAKLG